MFRYGELWRGRSEKVRTLEKVKPKIRFLFALPLRYLRAWRAYEERLRTACLRNSLTGTWHSIYRRHRSP